LYFIASLLKTSSEVIFITAQSAMHTKAGSTAAKEPLIFAIIQDSIQKQKQDTDPLLTKGSVHFIIITTDLL
jgi:hypothetical protein